MKRWIAVVALVLAGTAAANAQTVKRINVAGGPIGGTWYILGGGAVRLVEKYVPGVRGTIEAGGGVQNARNVGLKKVVFAFTGSDNAFYAVTGAREFKEKYALRGVLVGNPNHLHVVTLASSGIKSVTDFRGKRIAVGPPGSTTDALSRVVLGAYGLGDQDVKRQWLQFREMVEALKDGTTDAGFLASGYPAASIIDLTSMHAIRFVPIDEQKAPEILKQHPYLSVASIPGGTYKNQTETVRVIANTAYLVTHQDTDGDLVYRVARAITDHIDEFKAVHSAGQDWSLDHTAKGMAIEIHEGTRRLLKEKGLGG